MRRPNVTIHHGDCIAILRGMPENSVEAVVTDPPYSWGFMGRAWDAHASPREYQDWCRQWAAGCLRVLKPGGFMLTFGGTRTVHRIGVAVEDAGFEIRDRIICHGLGPELAWEHAAGFPKSVDVARAVGGDSGRWRGWGTALKPANEPVLVARKPLSGTVGENVAAWGAGGLNIDGCRVGAEARVNPSASNVDRVNWRWNGDETEGRSTSGRWPPNVLLVHAVGCEPVGTTQVRAGDPDRYAGTDGGTFAAFPDRPPVVTTAGDTGTETVTVWACASDCQVAELDRQSGRSTSTTVAEDQPLQRQDNIVSGAGLGSMGPGNRYSDTGGASRFFPQFWYGGKANPTERPGYFGPPSCGHVPDTTHPDGWPAWATDRDGTCPDCGAGTQWVEHPTVKPVDLMRWLVRLVTPPGGTVLDPFGGSGATAEAAILEGVDCVTVEKTATYIPLIRQRLARYDDPVTYAQARATGITPRPNTRKTVKKDTGGNAGGLW